MKEKRGFPKSNGFRGTPVFKKWVFSRPSTTKTSRQLITFLKNRTIEGGDFMGYKMTKKERDTMEQMRSSLIEKLTEKSMDTPYYLGLVDDYCELYEILRGLAADIKERGVSILWQNGKDQYGYKKNDSCGEYRSTNNQMLKILSELGLRGADIKVIEDEDMEFL